MTPKDTKAAVNNTKSDTSNKKDSQIDFSKLTMGQQDSTDTSPDLNKAQMAKQEAPVKQEAVVKQEKIAKQEPSANIMSSANEEAGSKQVAPQIDMNQLSMAKIKAPEHTQKVELGDSGVGIEMYGRRFEISYRRVFLTSFFVIFLFGLLSIFLGSYSKYLKVSTGAVIPPIYQPLVEKYDEYEQKFSKYLRFSDYENYLNIKIYGPRTEQNLEKILMAEKVNYIHKKNIIQNNLDELSQSTLEQFEDLNTLKQEISKFGFLSEELYTILAGQKQIQPIKKSLLSLEVIKFSSAMRVFSYLDTFLEGFASVIKIPTSEIESHLQNVMERGENDIYVYLNNCYLNPFERDYDCKAIGDFDLYYDLIQNNNSSFNRDHFKQLIKYIDLKLEQTDIPSFSIVFRKFDPSKDQITFSIDVNTFQKDEIALLQKNILNPHVFVVTQLLNLLKQSIFVVGESIDIKKLDVQNKVVQIGSQQFNINNSKMSFSLPIQKSTQREIFDFVESMDNRYEGSKTLQITQDMNQIDTTHSAANIISGDIDSDVNNTSNNDEIKNILDNNISYAFSEYYARKLLNLQKEDARIQYILQEQGEVLVIQERAAQVELLQYVDGFTQEEIQEVFDYIIESNLLDSIVVDVGLLRQKNDTGKMLFEVFQESQSSQELTDKAVGDTIEEQTKTETGFAQVRNFFSSGTSK